jgi:hypothetical protein
MRYPPDAWKKAKAVDKGTITEETLAELLTAAEDEDDEED